MSQPASRSANALSTALMVAGVLFCIGATVVEFNRAMDGHGRAWIYTFQWPLIGAFLVWIWYRYRTEGNVVGGIAQHYRDQVSQAQAESEPEDPDLKAWQNYVKGLDREDP